MNYLYKISTGELVSNSSDDIDPPTGMSVISTDKTGLWNSTTLDFDPLLPETRLKTEVFFDRFTQAELENLIVTARTNAKAAVFLKRLDLKDRVDLADPLLQADISSMETAGILSTARVQEILNV